MFNKSKHFTLNELHCLDLKSLKWKKKKELKNCERCNHSTFVKQNKLYIFGGKLFLGNPKNDLIGKIILFESNPPIRI